MAKIIFTKEIADKLRDAVQESLKLAGPIIRKASWRRQADSIGDRCCQELERIGERWER